MKQNKFSSMFDGALLLGLLFNLFPGASSEAGVEATYAGQGLGYRFSLSCIIPSTPFWDDPSVDNTDFSASGVLDFPSNFSFPFSGSASGGALTARTRVNFDTDSVPLEWMTIVEDADLLRVLCLWCDEFKFQRDVSQYEIVGQPGNRIFRFTIDGKRHNAPGPRLYLAAQASLYESTGMIKIHYKELSLAILGHGALGVQFDTGQALNVGQSILDKCEPGLEPVLMYTPVQHDLCEPMSCGEFGACIDGLCKCAQGFSGEYCEIPPSKPTLILEKPEHNGRDEFLLTIEFDKVIPKRKSVNMDIIEISGQGWIPSIPPIETVPNRVLQIRVIPFSNAPGEIRLFLPPEAFGLTEPSKAEVVVPYKPEVVLSSESAVHDGLSPFNVTIKFSSLVTDFTALSSLKVQGHAFLQGPITQIEKHREYVFLCVPTNERPRTDMVLWAEEGALNHGQSYASNKLLVEYERASRLFEYESDFDKNGLFYWIGTNRSTTSWANPSGPWCIPDVTCIVAKRSSSGSAKDDPSCITQRSPRTCFTGSQLNAWWSVDLGEGYKFQVFAYTLRDGESDFADQLRNWELQGSNDLVEWYTIKQHANDDSLSGPGHQSYTWKIGQSPYNVGFRHFRVQITGPNNAGTYYLNMAGMELYGNLYDTDDPCANMNCGTGGQCLNTDPPSCLCHDGYLGNNCEMGPEYWRAAYLPQTSAFSEKGIFYSLGTEGAASQAYVNPGTIGIIKVNSSVIESDNELGPLCILNHTFEPCYTRAVFAPYWEIDMGVFLVKLTAYSLASGSPEGLDFHPRTWSLEVSLNGSEWEVVDRRIEDASMTAAAPKQLFNLREKAPPARYIRLLMEDRNEASTFHFAVSGLELYGELNVWLDECVHSSCGLYAYCQDASQGCACAPGFEGEQCLIRVCKSSNGSHEIQCVPYVPPLLCYAVETPQPLPPVRQTSAVPLILGGAAGGVVVITLLVIATIVLHRKRALAKKLKEMENQLEGESDDLEESSDMEKFSESDSAEELYNIGSTKTPKDSKAAPFMMPKFQPASKTAKASLQKRLKASEAHVLQQKGIGTLLTMPESGPTTGHKASLHARQQVAKHAAKHAVQGVPQAPSAGLHTPRSEDSDDGYVDGLCDEATEESPGPQGMREGPLSESTPNNLQTIIEAGGENNSDSDNERKSIGRAGSPTQSNESVTELSFSDFPLGSPGSLQATSTSHPPNASETVAREGLKFIRNRLGRLRRFQQREQERLRRIQSKNKISRVVPLPTWENPYDGDETMEPMGSKEAPSNALVTRAKESVKRAGTAAVRARWFDQRKERLLAAQRRRMEPRPIAAYSPSAAARVLQFGGAPRDLRDAHSLRRGGERSVEDILKELEEQAKHGRRSSGE